MKTDPFRLAEAGQELRASFSPLQAQPDHLQAGPFLQYFTPPRLAGKNIPRGSQKSPIHWLREAGHFFIYGPAGSGKTMLRLFFESETRVTPNGTLVVTLSLREAAQKGLPAALAEALAVDTFVQFCERFNPLNPPPQEEQMKALARLIKHAAGALRQLARRLLAADEPKNPMAYGIYWGAVGRSTVRKVEMSKQLHHLLLEVLEIVSELPDRRPTSMHELQASLEDVRLLGFLRVDILIDEADASFEVEADASARFRRMLSTDESSPAISPEAWQLNSLLEALPALESQQVYIKCFLPEKWLSFIDESVIKYTLTGMVFHATIRWDRTSLLALLRQRFRAAGSRRLSIEGLAGADLEGRLERVLLASAGGSPRRLLLLCSRLIEARLQRSSDQPDFSAADWERMRRDWPYAQSTPKKLPSR